MEQCPFSKARILSVCQFESFSPQRIWKPHHGHSSLLLACIVTKKI
jgi:hypothetical protein